MDRWAPIVAFLVVLFGMYYFFTIKPIRQREKRHDAMVLELQKGDKVLTAGGIYGQVERIDEDSVVLKVESGAMIRVTKGGIVARPHQDSEDFSRP